MKTLCVLCVLIIFSLKNTYSQWERSNGLSDGVIRCMVVSDSSLFVGTETGIFETSNDGDEWHCVTDKMPIDRLRKLVVIQDTIFALSKDKGLFKSSDHGKSWENVYKTADSAVTVFVEGSLIMLGCGTGIYKSEDYGKTWVKSRHTIAPVTTILRYENNIIASKYRDSIFYSNDNGKIWKGNDYFPNEGIFVYDHKLYYYEISTLYTVVQLQGGFQTVSPLPLWGTPMFVVGDTNLGDTTVYSYALNGVFRNNYFNKRWNFNEFWVDLKVPRSNVNNIYVKEKRIYASSETGELYVLDMTNDNNREWKQINNSILNTIEQMVKLGDRILA